MWSSKGVLKLDLFSKIKTVIKSYFIYCGNKLFLFIYYDDCLFIVFKFKT